MSVEKEKLDRLQQSLIEFVQEFEEAQTSVQQLRKDYRRAVDEWRGDQREDYPSDIAKEYRLTLAEIRKGIRDFRESDELQAILEQTDLVLETSTYRHDEVLDLVLALAEELGVSEKDVMAAFNRVQKGERVEVSAR